MMLVALHELGYPIELVVTDPNRSAARAWWLAAVSLLGLICWGLASATFACAAWARRAYSEDSSTWLFLALAAGAFLVLGIDDALMLHEEALSRSNRLAQLGVQLVYVSAAAAWAIRFRLQLLQRPLLFGALLCLAASLVIDATSPSVAVEEYAKYVGLWSLVLAGVKEMGSAVPASRTLPRKPQVANSEADAALRQMPEVAGQP